MIDHLEGDGVALAPDRDPDLAAVGAELHRVVHEVHDDLAEPGLVAVDGRKPRFHLRPQRHAVALGEQPEALRGCHREAAQVHVVVGSQLRTALDAGEVQHLADHLGQVPGLHLDPGDPLAHARGHVRGLSLAREGLGEERDRRQGRPQLVAKVVDELGADLLEPSELRDVLEDHDEVVRREPAGADQQEERLWRPRAVLGGGGTPEWNGVERGLEAGVEERLHHAPAGEGGRRAEENLGPLVGGPDPVAGADPQHADGQQVLGDRPRGGLLVGSRIADRGRRRLSSRFGGRGGGVHGGRPLGGQAVQLVGAAAHRVQRGGERERQPDDRDPQQRLHGPEDRTRSGVAWRAASAPGGRPARPAPPHGHSPRPPRSRPSTERRGRRRSRGRRRAGAR